jgi:hypothetical protein
VEGGTPSPAPADATFRRALAAARTRFSLPDSEIAAILADAVAT